MPSGRHKSKSLRKVFVKTPGNRTVVHYRKRKLSRAKCSSCGVVLLGVTTQRPHRMQNMPKTKKRPTRPYGGQLCSRCTKELIKQKARANV